MKANVWLPLSCAALSFSLAAQSPAELTIYTYSSFVSDWGPGPALTPLFEEQCDCTINWVGLDDGVSILNRLKLEKGNSKADVILGLDTQLMQETRALGAVQDFELSLPTLAFDWTETDFVPFDYGYFAFVYNTETLENPPSSMADLLDNFEGKVIYQDPRTSTPGQGLMLWMKSIYGDQSDAAWKKLATKTVTVTKGWSEAYGMFLKGESDLVLSYTTSPAYHVVAEQDERFAAALFSEGHVAQIEVAAVSANSEQTELANQFLSFLISEPAQAIIATTNWMLPVNPQAELPEAFSQLIQVKDIPVDSNQAAEMRQTWTKEWRNALSL
ncbi:thiamine ABC transporter substrate binding subunit [Alginatibacterium sediminis]|uniref:Thiamine-binding periplasmic protein n=1 Tax=Alginatibacterium sediminis TaxID=2164068 RepID=A0A420ECV5_9ALTE|nr:thiamine ABC transporter substrate binding subunit [Alginatibacterium sediminis]RKF18506.1 thiamine ABC transporter substrate binding subunit [Alginatibacterium sediminis]